LDDIVIVTPTFKEHMVWLKKILEKMSTADLTVNLDKFAGLANFTATQVCYLGFIQEGLTVDPDKTQPKVLRTM